MTEYMSVDELSSAIKFSKQTLYNKIFSGEFVKGYHYIKPSRRKVLFKWAAIEEWLNADCNAE